MLSAAIIKITRLSTPMSVFTSASERFGRSASGSFLRSINVGCGFCGCCDFASDFFGCCDDCGCGFCAAVPGDEREISNVSAVKTILFIFRFLFRIPVQYRARKQAADLDAAACLRARYCTNLIVQRCRSVRILIREELTGGCATLGARAVVRLRSYYCQLAPESFL